MKAEKTFVAQVTAEIASLDDEIEKQANTIPEAGVLRQQLRRLYELICGLAEYERPAPAPEDLVVEADKALLAVWDKLLLTVQRLSDTKPNGPFLTARLALFIMFALPHQQTLGFDLPESEHNRARVQHQLGYCFNLDESLLSCLCHIWQQNPETEDFLWATTHMEYGLRSDYNEKAMTSLSPAELWEVPGMTGGQLWKPKPGDAPIYEGFEHSTSTVVGEPDETGQQPVIRQTLYSDGPLVWKDSAFCFIREDSESWLHGPGLRRSNQFVLDVRQRLHHTIVRRRNYLAYKAMSRGGLPQELQRYVVRDIDTPVRHPYLSHFSLSEAYRPFPRQADEACSSCSCGSRAEQASTPREQTCPRKSVTIWNLGLRVFHTFHETARGKLVMCRQAEICPGHHGDSSWAIRSDAQLANYIRNFIKTRCGQSATLSSVGLGPLWTPENPQGCIIRRPIPTYGLNKSGRERTIEAEGGLYGHFATMLHRKVAANACKIESEPHKCYTTDLGNDTWIRARNSKEQRRVGKDMTRLHRRGFCYYPQWCTALTGRLVDDGNSAIDDESGGSDFYEGPIMHSFDLSESSDCEHDADDGEDDEDEAEEDDEESSSDDY
ncbi:hypothetical protein HJFPF1_05111 [Paramyrothecium foliicola]|nr:hypothetical protein HJFPF1_05111 [Paramyrothecium foliicola]